MTPHFTKNPKQRIRARRIVSLLTLISGVSLCLTPLRVEAAKSFDTLNFKPANDHGYYLTVEQSQTLGQGGFAVGLTGDYSKNPLVLRSANGLKLQDAIEQQVSLNLGAAVGLTDWLNLGVNVSGIPYQKFVTPGTLVQDNGGRMGDIVLNSKVRLLSNKDYPVGVALVPFITFPTGKSSYFVGNGKVTGGGKLVLDTARIGDRVSFSVNAGGQVRDKVTLAPGAQTINDQFLYGAAVNVAIAKPVQFIAEVNGWTPFDKFFKSNNRNLEVDGALRILPGENSPVEITAGGGAGVNKDVGIPDWRVFTTVAYRQPRKEEAPAPLPAPVPQEEVITTHAIHFAFNKSNIRSESFPMLDKILAEIKGRSEVDGVRVEGYTDDIGSEEFNLKLSQRRADAVRDYFVKSGYPTDKITAVGMGKANPIADNTTKEGRAQNRRVEFHLQVKPGANVRVEKQQGVSPTFEEEKPVRHHKRRHPAKK